MKLQASRLIVNLLPMAHNMKKYKFEIFTDVFKQNIREGVFRPGQKLPSVLNLKVVEVPVSPYAGFDIDFLRKACRSKIHHCHGTRCGNLADAHQATGHRKVLVDRRRPGP